MIQIDDAGSGSFIGGTCIGIYRPETNEYYFDIIPVELYLKENFKKKLYLDRVVDIVKDAFESLKVNKNETIEICRGYMFEKLKAWLDENHFHWYCTHITGRVQEVVEKNFELYAVRLGLPEQYIKYTKYPFHFHKLLRWVFADFESRISLCKTGWKSWEKMEHIKPQVYWDKVKSPNIYCLRCGEHIPMGSSAKVLRYFSNRGNFVYLHNQCEPHRQ
ncbi:MAG: hypothetical protein QHH06_02595 [Clostridiales bacterium]|jgi:hypothetical protein|nr:hypothetical protein [Eubacteriales bacterium]MDH7565359.1 hypothetical protein [Clostridiales bacterium]